MMEIVPAKQQTHWNVLELRVLILVSLFFQIVLIVTGNRRKYIKRKLVAPFLWISYLLADSVATLALGVLSKAQGDAKSLPDPSYTIMAFWAPFLLMHLGGPDTITAYALADNELWSRHLLGLLSQVGVAIYVRYRSWTGTSMNHLWILIFLAGLVKYGERTWVLYSASKNQFRQSIVSGADPGPNYAKFMDELVSKEQEGYEVCFVKAIDTIPYYLALNNPAENPGEGTQEDILQEAYYLFGTFKKLFADLILSFQDQEDSRSIFNSNNMTWDKAFSIVEVELGLVFDLFYTKSSLIYSLIGFLLRLFTCSFTIAAFITFLMIDKTDHLETDLIITYVLLIGAIFLEFYAVMILLSSDWVMIWLSGDWTTIPPLRNFKDLIAVPIRRVASVLQKLHIVPARRRWSDAIGQYNILNCCIKGKKKCTKVRQYLEKYIFWESASVPKGLKALVFDELKKRVEDDERKVGNYRGDKRLLKRMSCFDKSDEVEFDQSVLLWHLATDLCYQTDVNENEEPDRKWLSECVVSEKSALEVNLKFKREICKLLSNYMMHLLIMSPFMLPSGIGQIRIQDTCAEAIEFFNRQKLDKRDACEKLRRVDTRLAPSKVKGDRSKSLLFDACRLVKSLESEVGNQKWEIITQAWLDMLTFAAAQCRWNDHAEKLSQGGELLTHVWLLMAHFGMTDQFQISEGYVRAKLQLA